jgi:hypothetical protein
MKKETETQKQVNDIIFDWYKNLNRVNGSELKEVGIVDLRALIKELKKVIAS